MSSYIMHMCVSNIVKEKLKLTDKFIYGCILPDILKMTTEDRKGTHYLVKVKTDNSYRNLPDIDKAICNLQIEDKEIRLGYIAHLVEDLIWFKDFIPTFAKKLEDGKYEYIATRELKDEKDFKNDIYLDYLNCGAYVIESTNTDLEKIKKNIARYITEQKSMDIVLDNTKYTQITDIKNNHFMTKESIDKYIEKATKEVENIMMKLIGE